MFFFNLMAILSFLKKVKFSLEKQGNQSYKADEGKTISCT